MSNNNTNNTTNDTFVGTENPTNATTNATTTTTATTRDNVPVWQPDEQAPSCFVCGSEFTLFFRRHHCRKCGRVVCNPCSSVKTTYPRSTYVVSPPSQIFLESPHVPHRTCDICLEELRMDQDQDQANAPQPPSNNTRSATRISADSVNITDDDLNHCPVCGKNMKRRTEVNKERHIQMCVTRSEFSGSPKQHRRNQNRMLIHTLPPDFRAKERDTNNNSTNNNLSELLAECTICFEDYEPGQNVARLECLCIYHERCIKDWFSRKGQGSCPVHAVHM